MRDEEYIFYQDVREKKVTGYSARKQRTHCGKAGRVKLPSDYLTKKELKNMSGECKSYRLNSPMTFGEFMAMPEDLRIVYINAIREKYNAPNTAIAKMMGCGKDRLHDVLKELGFANGKKGPKRWDKMGFAEWCYGTPVAEETMQEEPVEIPQIDVPAEDVEPKVIGEDVTAVNEEVTACDPDIEDDAARLCEHHANVVADVYAIPETGSLTFTANATQIMNTLCSLLGDKKVCLHVEWTVVEG